MFKKNSPELKTLIGNLIVVALATIIAMIDYGGGFSSNAALSDFPFILGIAALGVGLLNIPIAIILFIAGSSDYGKGFLISAGILLLISGASCGGAAVFG